MDIIRTRIPSRAARTLRFGFPKAAEGAPSALLSLRSAGSMRFERDRLNPNRVRFFAGEGIDPRSVLAIELAHSRNVIFPASADDHRLLALKAAADGGADGILLEDRKLFASVTVADCMPIWILDRASGAFGVLHSGWKGTGILMTAARILAERFGTAPESISAILGPAIGSCCYAVPEERAAAFAREFGDSAAPLVGGKRRIDLRAANLSLAQRLGIGAVLSVEACTCCDSRLGSYRREGSESFTRMVAAVGSFPTAANGETIGR
jgi:YfiH family protein